MAYVDIKDLTKYSLDKATSVTTIADTDKVVVSVSPTSAAKIPWTNVKDLLKTYFDALYYDKTNGTTAYTHSQITGSNPHGITPAILGVLPLTGGTLTGNLVIDGNLTATNVYGAVFNDYAEYRKCTLASAFLPGTVMMESGDSKIHMCNKRLSPAVMVVSDSYGSVLGDSYRDSIPVAVAGWVRVWVDRDRSKFKVGDAVCSGLQGKASKMRWWEKIFFPDRILGTVSYIPPVGDEGDDRIWIRVK